MHKVCTSEKVAFRQELLEDCLLSAMQEKPYAEIFVRELCEMANIPRRLFYRYFDNKEDVLNCLIDRTILEGPDIDILSEDNLTSIKNMLFYCKQCAPLLDALQANHMNTLLLERVIMHTVYNEFDTPSKLQAAGQPVCIESFVFLLSGIICLAQYWHQTGFQKSEDEMAVLIQQLLKNSFVTA